MNNYHTSVLLPETIDGLHVKEKGKYIDATLGGGGHTGEIIRRGGIVLGIDVDTDALEFVKKTYQMPIGLGQLQLAKGNFRDIDTIARARGFDEVDGIVFDLGVSSHQFDVPERGFSFREDAPLDMRMDMSLSVTARDLVNGLTKGELYELFTKLGEEHFARRISENIVRTREIKSIETTKELAHIAEMSYPRGFHKIHPATKIFQALRIAVNGELENIEEALPKAVLLLRKNGRLAVISFHSLEDRIVKNVLRDLEAKGIGKNITAKPIAPGEKEQEENKRARSSKLRIFEKI